MNNCLVTKLLGTVNENLPYLGKVRIGVAKGTDSAATAPYRRLRVIYNTPGLTLLLKGNAHFTDVTLTADNGQSIQLAADAYAATSYVSNESGMALADKYAITEINNKYEQSIDLNSVFSLYSEDFAYSTALTTLQTPGAPIHGTLDEFAACPLSVVNWKFCTFDEDASFDFVNGMTTLTSFDIQGVSDAILRMPVTHFIKSIGLTKIDNRYRAILQGTLESLCEGMIANGRTSGSLQVIGGAVTLNGISDGGSATYNITFSDSGCTISATASSRTATYSGGTWSYS